MFTIAPRDWTWVLSLASSGALVFTGCTISFILGGRGSTNFMLPLCLLKATVGWVLDWPQVQVVCGSLGLPIGHVIVLFQEHWKNPEFPLARIKKIMRMDEEVRVCTVWWKLKGDSFAIMPFSFLWLIALMCNHQVFIHQMISAEVPVMFSKAVEIFIAELSMRAWQHTEESKRRTIQVTCTLVWILTALNTLL